MRYQFPKKLNTNIQPFIKFSSFKWSVRGKKSQEINATRTSQDTIVLPISNNGLTNTITSKWSEEDILRSSNFLEGLKNVVAQKARELTTRVGGRYNFYKRGIALNDFASLLYNGVDLREFAFTYSLIPESKTESDLLRSIIKAFKRNSLGEYQGWKILYPNFWKISLVSPQSKDIVKFKDCVMVTFQENLFTESQFTFTDGSPIRINFDMSFRELEKIDRRDYS